MRHWARLFLIFQGKFNSCLLQAVLPTLSLSSVVLRTLDLVPSPTFLDSKACLGH